MHVHTNSWVKDFNVDDDEAPGYSGISLLVFLSHTSKLQGA